MLRSARSGWFGVGLCCLLLAAGCSPQSAAPATKAPPRVSVAHPVVRSLVDEDDYSGWLQAVETVDVRAKVRGFIAKIHFKDGDVVERNQLLFELDPRPFQAALDESVAQERAVDAQRVAAEKDAARYAELLRSSATSQQEYDKAVANAQSFAAQVAARAQAVVENKLNLEYSRVTAQIGGRIGRALLTEGNLVNAGGTDPVLTTIVSITPIYAYFTIDERSMQRYMRMNRSDRDQKPGEPIRELKIPFRFGLDTDEGFPNQGLLDFTNNKVDSSTGTIEVRGVIPNEKGLFVPGSRVRVRVPVSDPYTAMLVPDTAVNTDQDQKFLLLVDAADKNVVKRRTIRPGRLLDDGMRVVLSAQPELNKDEWVIVDGLQRARLNYPVEPIAEATSPSAPASPAAKPQ